MKINGITCSVEIDGEYTEEYEEETSKHGRQRTCYIASSEGKPFAFNLDLGAGVLVGMSVDWDISADGELVQRTHTGIRRGMKPLKLKTARLQSVLRPGIVEERPFRFGKLETAETVANNLETRANVVKNVGTLKVVIWQAVRLRTNAAPVLREWDFRASSSAAERKPILEKALKGRSVPHRTDLGEASFRSVSTFSTMKINPPLATFVFKYSSKESLKNQLIIPREQEDDLQEAEENGDDLENMSVAEMRRELRRRREAEAAAEDDLPHKLGVKREGQEYQRRRPIIRPGPVETIDLTDID